MMSTYRLVASIQADRNEAQQNRIKLSQKMKKKKTIKQKTGGCSTHAGWTMSSWHYIAESIRCCIRWQNENRIKKNEDNRRNKSEGNKMIGSNNRCVCHMLKKKMGDWEKKKGEFKIQAVVCFLLLVHIEPAGSMCVVRWPSEPSMISGLFRLVSRRRNWHNTIDFIFLFSIRNELSPTGHVQSSSAQPFSPDWLAPFSDTRAGQKGIENSSQRRVKKGFFSTTSSAELAHRRIEEEDRLGIPD